MSEQRLIRVQEKGQITLPSGMRKKLGLKKGDLVAAIETADGVLITRQEVLATRTLERLGDLLREKGLSLDELIDYGREIRGGLIEAEYDVKPAAK